MKYQTICASLILLPVSLFTITKPETSYLSTTLFGPINTFTWRVANYSIICVPSLSVIFFSPLRSIPADGFIAWRNFLSVFPFVKLANKSGMAILSVTKNCSMGAIYLTWQGCFRRFLIFGAELSKYDFFLQNIAILITFSSGVNW